MRCLNDVLMKNSGLSRKKRIEKVDSSILVYESGKMIQNEGRKDVIN